MFVAPYCMCVCACVCMHVCACVCECNVHVCVRASMCVSMHVCVLHACMWACVCWTWVRKWHFMSIIYYYLLYTLTHISFVFEGEVAVWSATVKMSRPLSVKATGGCPTILSGSKPLKAFLDNGRVLAVVVGMHLNIGCANVHLVAARLKEVQQ